MPQHNYVIQPRLMEQVIVRALCEHLTLRGFYITVYSGASEPDVKESPIVDDIMEAAFACDTVCLVVTSRDGDNCCTLQLVHGNDGFDVIADYAGEAFYEDELKWLDALAIALEMEGTAVIDDPALSSPSFN